MGQQSQILSYTEIAEIYRDQLLQMVNIFYILVIMRFKKFTILKQFSQMVAKVVQLLLPGHPGQIHHNIRPHRHPQDHQHLGPHHHKDQIFREPLLIRQLHNTMGQIKRDHLVHQVKHNKYYLARESNK